MKKLVKQIRKRIKKLQEEPTDVNIGKVAELNLVTIRLQQLILNDVENNEVALKAFVEEYVEAFENGQGSDTSLYRQAKNLLLLPTNK